MLDLACLAADLGDWNRAAVLHGVAQAFLDRSGRPWEDLVARYRQDSLAQVRAHLGDERFDRAYRPNRGRMQEGGSAPTHSRIGIGETWQTLAPRP